MVDIEYIELNEIPDVNPEFLFSWYTDVVTGYKKELGDITVIFCDDEYLLEMNREHLQHDYYTDIITFDYTEGSMVSGDLFISLDRVRENALSHDVAFMDELHRVCIHGVLHLCGLKDKSEEDEKTMREAENSALAQRMFHVEHLKSN
jgi:rRNA maturation RNase YbeY